MIRTSFAPMTKIHDAVTEAHAKAVEAKEPVTFDFNGREIIVRPEHSLEHAQHDAHKALFGPHFGPPPSPSDNDVRHGYFELIGWMSRAVALGARTETRLLNDWRRGGMRVARDIDARIAAFGSEVRP